MAVPTGQGIVVLGEFVLWAVGGLVVGLITGLGFLAIAILVGRRLRWMQPHG